MIVIDTNLLVFAFRKKTPQHNAAVEVINSAVQSIPGWGVTLPSLLEFLRVVTHPSIKAPSSVREARRFIQALRQDGDAQLLIAKTDTFYDRLAALAVDLNIKGNRIFDLHIALLAFDAGATELWTDDRNFVRIYGLSVVHPLA